MKHDEDFLFRAFELARLGRFTTSPNPNVGCVIVRNGVIVGEGYHQKAGEPHAEIHALRMAGKASHGSTAYITLEPCSHYGNTPPCVDALINNGIKRVVSTITDPNPKVAGRGFYQLKQANINVKYGLMSQEAEEINLGFLKRMRTGLPWVRLKLAASLDGRTATASGESKWITADETRRDVQRWRAESDAILSTASTVLADNPSLNIRWTDLPKDIQNIYPQMQLIQPLRIIIDSANRITPEHKVICDGGKTYLARIIPDDLIWPKFTKQIKIPNYNLSKSKHLDLKELLTQLGRYKINNLLVESGAHLSGALLSSGLVDELILYLAPKLLGSDARPLCFLSKLEQLSSALKFIIIDVLQINTDIRLRLKPIKL